MMVGSRERLRSRLIAAAFGVVVVAMLIPAGCAAEIPVERFEGFEAATTGLAAESDDALAAVASDWRSAFSAGEPLRVGESEGEARLTPSRVRLQFDAQPLDPSYDDPPDHVLLEESRGIAADLNGAVAEYARYLLELAGADADPERLAGLASEANAGLRSARDELTNVGLGGSELLADRNLAIVSAVGVEILRQRIQSERRALLSETLADAQPVVEEFSGLMSVLIQLVAGGERERYEAWFDERSREFSAAGQDVAGQREVIARIDARNRATLERMAVLRSLRDAYEQLPQAHRSLLEALDREEAPLDAVRRLYEDVRRLRQTVRDLEDSTDQGDEQ